MTNYGIKGVVLIKFTNLTLTLGEENSLRRNETRFGQTCHVFFSNVRVTPDVKRSEYSEVFPLRWWIPRLLESEEAFSTDIPV